MWCSRPRGCRDDDFGGWWSVTGRPVWPERVVEAAPALDDDACHILGDGLFWRVSLPWHGLIFLDA